MTIIRQRLEDLPPLSEARVAELRALQDGPIDYSDIPELDADFWANAHVQYPRDPKVPVALRLKPEVLAWFKGFGDGYTTRMADVLQRFYEHQRQER